MKKYNVIKMLKVFKKDKNAKFYSRKDKSRIIKYDEYGNIAAYYYNCKEWFNIDFEDIYIRIK